MDAGCEDHYDFYLLEWCTITNSVLNRPDFPQGCHTKHGLFKSELVIVSYQCSCSIMNGQIFESLDAILDYAHKEYSKEWTMRRGMSLSYFDQVSNQQASFYFKNISSNFKEIPYTIAAGLLCIKAEFQRDKDKQNSIEEDY